MKFAAILTRLILGVAFCAALASADEYTLDFNIAVPTAGMISYAGGGNPLAGSAISIDSVDSLNDTPLNNDVLRSCLSCSLSFTTGDFLSYSSGIWTFAPGGTLTVSGTLDLNGDGTADSGDAIGTLMTGSFTDPTMVVAAGGSFKVAVGAFGDTVNSTLSNFYGLPDSTIQPYAGNFNVSFLANGAPGGAFNSSTMLSGDIETSVPEPLSILLLGTALFGCAMIAKRRLA